MKKRTLKERKEDFKKAYYAGLKEQGLVDTVEETNNDLSTNVEQTVEKKVVKTTKKTTTKKTKEVEK